MAMTPPADIFLILISCCVPAASTNLPIRSIAETRSSSRRSTGRGTAVDRETVVDSNADSIWELPFRPDFLRISDSNIAPLPSAHARQNGTLWTAWLKERFLY